MTPAQKLDKRIVELGDWRGPALTRLRKLIEAAGPKLSLEWKWDTAIWTQDGLVCGISAFRDHVKMNFFKGASLSDPHKLFNSGLDSKQHRSINVSKTDKLNEAGLKELVRAAAAHNSVKHK